MRVRVWIVLGAAAIGLGLGFLGRGTDIETFTLLGGLAWLTALTVGVSLLPFWKQVLPEVPPMPGLFDAVPEGGRWCTHCGNPAAQEGACSVCGVPARARKA